MNKPIVSLPPPPPLDSQDALFLDFDGTLVDLAPTPHGITVPSSLDALFAATGARLNGALAIVSGRSAREIRGLLPTADATVVGMHGAEVWHANGRRETVAIDADVLRAARSHLESSVADTRGVLFEDKALGYALHYRAVPDAAALCHAAVEAAAAASGGTLRARPGNMVIDLCPTDADKGTAIRSLLDLPPFRGRRPVFVGDDLPDEDGFAAVAEAGGHGVLVGPVRPTAATARLDSVEAVRRWLADFAGHRAP